VCVSAGSGQRCGRVPAGAGAPALTPARGAFAPPPSLHYSLGTRSRARAAGAVARRSSGTARLAAGGVGTHGDSGAASGRFKDGGGAFPASHAGPGAGWRAGRGSASASQHGGGARASAAAGGRGRHPKARAWPGPARGRDAGRGRRAQKPPRGPNRRDGTPLSLPPHLAAVVRHAGGGLGEHVGRHGLAGPSRGSEGRGGAPAGVGAAHRAGRGGRGSLDATPRAR